jgi:predicted RNA polymerase sigma factor
MHHPHQVLKQLARDSYGRLLAYLSARSQDIMLAEDALGEAMIIALQTWTEAQVPANPEAWLLTVARRKLIDGLRRQHTFSTRIIHLLEHEEGTPEARYAEGAAFPDDRLKLLFVCAHPAIDPSMHTPLMLQTVLGLNAAQIASAFLVAPSTMGQRLVRAKAKIRDAGLAFEVPESEELPERLMGVLEAIYAAYTVGWDSSAGSDPRPKGLTEEGLELARMAVTLLPGQSEAKGLLALLLFCEARGPARRSLKGYFVPLSEQDTGLWSQPMILEAEQWLRQASLSPEEMLGRFQLEAAIQSAHVQGRRQQQTDWEALILLYEGLVQVVPTLGALVSRAAAIAEGRGLTAGIEALSQIPADAVENYQPYWSLKASLLHKTNDALGAKAAYQKAIGLTEDASVREYLLQRLSGC